MTIFGRGTRVDPAQTAAKPQQQEPLKDKKTKKLAHVLEKAYKLDRQNTKSEPSAVEHRPGSRLHDLVKTKSPKELDAALTYLQGRMDGKGAKKAVNRLCTVSALQGYVKGEVLLQKGRELGSEEMSPENFKDVIDQQSSDDLMAAQDYIQSLPKTSDPQEAEARSAVLTTIHNVRAERGESHYVLGKDDQLYAVPMEAGAPVSPKPSGGQVYQHEGPTPLWTRPAALPQGESLDGAVHRSNPVFGMEIPVDSDDAASVGDSVLSEALSDVADGATSFRGRKYSTGSDESDVPPPVPPRSLGRGRGAAWMANLGDTSSSDIPAPPKRGESLRLDGTHVHDGVDVDGLLEVVDEAPAVPMKKAEISTRKAMMSHPAFDGDATRAKDSQLPKDHYYLRGSANKDMVGNPTYTLVISNGRTPEKVTVYVDSTGDIRAKAMKQLWSDVDTAISDILKSLGQNPKKVKLWAQPSVESNVSDSGWGGDRSPVAQLPTGSREDVRGDVVLGDDLSETEESLKPPVPPRRPQQVVQRDGGQPPLEISAAPAAADVPPPLPPTSPTLTHARAITDSPAFRTDASHSSPNPPAGQFYMYDTGKKMGGLTVYGMKSTTMMMGSPNTFAHEFTVNQDGSGYTLHEDGAKYPRATIDALVGEGMTPWVPTTIKGLCGAMLGTNGLPTFEQTRKLDEAVHGGKYRGKMDDSSDKLKAEVSSKSRYTNINVVDSTAVTLGDDQRFIHANYVTGTDGKRYIATQGPKSDKTLDGRPSGQMSTQADFWEMMWQEGSTDIAMVTNLEEGGKEKCSKYWPELGKTLTFQTPSGTIEVEAVEEKGEDGHMVRRFEMRKTFKKSGFFGREKVEGRTVTQHQFMGWPDHGVPETPQQLIGFVREVRKGKTSEAPLVVHCSAGVGRTGTLMAVDQLIEIIASGRDITIRDVMRVVTQLRAGRHQAVQSEAQYNFLFQVADALNQERVA